MTLYFQLNWNDCPSKHWTGTVSPHTHLSSAPIKLHVSSCIQFELSMSFSFQSHSIHSIYFSKLKVGTNYMPSPPSSSSSKWFPSDGMERRRKKASTEHNLEFEIGWMRSFGERAHSFRTRSTCHLPFEIVSDTRTQRRKKPKCLGFEWVFGRKQNDIRSLSSICFFLFLFGALWFLCVSLLAWGKRCCCCWDCVTVRYIGQWTKEKKSELKQNQ